MELYFVLRRELRIKEEEISICPKIIKEPPFEGVRLRCTPSKGDLFLNFRIGS
jgi:hypothetical protein